MLAMLLLLGADTSDVAVLGTNASGGTVARH